MRARAAPRGRAGCSRATARRSPVRYTQRRAATCSRRGIYAPSELSSHAEARHDGQARRLGPALGVVVAIADKIRIDAVVGVDEVEVRAERPARELPAFVDADVELMKRLEALAAGGAGDAEIARGGAAVEASETGRVEVSGHVAKARAELPAAAHVVASEHRQNVSLVEVKELGGLARHPGALRARERVRKPAEEALVRLVAQHGFDTENASGSEIVVADDAARVGAARNEIVEQVEKALGRRHDVRRELLLDAERVLPRALGAKLGLGVAEEDVEE